MFISLLVCGHVFIAVGCKYGWPMTRVIYKFLSFVCFILCICWVVSDYNSFFPPNAVVMYPELARGELVLRLSVNLLIPWHLLSQDHQRRALSPRFLAPSLMNYISHNALSGLVFPSDLFSISPGIFKLPAFGSYFTLIKSMMLDYYLKLHKLQTPHTSSWYLQLFLGQFSTFWKHCHHPAL